MPPKIRRRWLNTKAPHEAGLVLGMDIQREVRVTHELHGCHSGFLNRSILASSLWVSSVARFGCVSRRTSRALPTSPSRRRPKFFSVGWDIARCTRRSACRCMRLARRLARMGAVALMTRFFIFGQSHLIAPKSAVQTKKAMTGQMSTSHRSTVMPPHYRRRQ